MHTPGALDASYAFRYVPSHNRACAQTSLFTPFCHPVQSFCGYGLGGKPKWLPLNFGYHDVMRTFSIQFSSVSHSMPNLQKRIDVAKMSDTKPEIFSVPVGENKSQRTENDFFIPFLTPIPKTSLRGGGEQDWRFEERNTLCHPSWTYCNFRELLFRQKQNPICAAWINCFE